MKLYKKIGGAVLALSVVAGAVPGAISSAAAIEHKGGQMMDKGPRWPHKSIHFVQLGLGIAALVAAIVLVAGNDDDKPTSP
ncbi:MAG: hypothetical protein WAT18_11655 [Sphingorhabdus sp.]